MTPQGWQRSFSVAGGILIGVGAVWFIVATFFSFSAIYPKAPVFRADSLGALSPLFLLVMAYALLVSAGFYAAGWAIWWRRGWARIVFFLTLAVFFALGLALAWLKYPRAWMAAVAFVTSPFIGLTLAFLFEPLWAMTGAWRHWQNAPTGRDEETGGWLGTAASALAILFLAAGVFFFRIGSPAAVLTALGTAALLTVFLVLCGWQAWNRVVGTIFVGAAVCALAAAFIVGALGLSPLPPLSRIPILAASGLLYVASMGITADGLVMAAVEGALPGAIALLLIGIPLVVSPPRRMTAPLAAKQVPLLALLSVLALAVPLVNELRPAREVPAEQPAAVAPAPVAKFAPPAPPPAPPRAREPQASSAPIKEEGPPQRSVAIPIERPPAPARRSAPVTVASTNLKVLERVAPQFPKETGKSGTVIVEVLINPSGEVIEVRELKGEREFVKAAMSAALRWKFAPYVVDGKPARVRTTLTFAFRAQ